MDSTSGRCWQVQPSLITPSAISTASASSIPQATNTCSPSSVNAACIARCSAERLPRLDPGPIAVFDDDRGPATFSSSQNDSRDAFLAELGRHDLVAEASVGDREQQRSAHAAQAVVFHHGCLQLVLFGAAFRCHGAPRGFRVMHIKRNPRAGRRGGFKIRKLYARVTPRDDE